MQMFRARRENIGKTYPRKFLEIALYSLINPFKGHKNLKKNICWAIVQRPGHRFRRNFVDMNPDALPDLPIHSRTRNLD